MLLISMLLHICGLSWVVGCKTGCVFLCFLWVYATMNVYAHVSVPAIVLKDLDVVELLRLWL